MHAAPIPADGSAPPGPPSTEDGYRSRLKWDSVARSSHLINCWYQRSCAFNVFVRDGVVVREEQSAAYPATNDSVPDFNPRGCQKGACYAGVMYDEARLLHPLKRAGQRGEGRWERVSWDDALADIADKVIDTLAGSGPDAMIFDQNPAGVASYTAVRRFADLLGAPVLDVNCEVGDEQQGAAITLGTPIASKSADDYFYSDLILIWGGNPAYTQIPNFHFYNEARYHGATVVTISPDYSPSAVHADAWLSVRPGTDAALALSMAQVIISSGLYDAGFVREQTDLPLLVRTDTGRYLRESDVRKRGGDDAFYVHDTATGRIGKARKKTLRLGDTVPALEGAFEVETRDGRVTVKPVFQVLREMVDRDYTPEQASAICGVEAGTIRWLATAIAGAKAASCVAGASLSKYYHGDLMARAQLLVFALCGQMGRHGAGYDTLPILMVDGIMTLPLAKGLGRLDRIKSLAPLIPTFLKLKMKGYTDEMAYYQIGRKQFLSMGLPAVLYWYYHGGLQQISSRSKEWDPHLTRDVESYLDESRRNGWQQFPPPTPPEVLFATPGNTLRRVRGAHRLIEEMVPRLSLMVTVEMRMTSTGMYSDYVLPAASSYEKCDVTDWYTPLAPFAHITNAAVPPVGEAKTEWEIFVRLAAAIDRRAQERGITHYADGDGKQRKLGDVRDRLTYGGTFTEDGHEAVAEAIIDASTQFGKTGWADMKSSGVARFEKLGGHPGNLGHSTDFTPGETIAPHTWHTQKKQPWPTLTRRIQFYIDQSLYLELGEQLPVHKEPPTAGGDYPLIMGGGHNRHSIHAAWRTTPTMLDMERGEAAISMSVEDAAARGIADGDRVRVRNDIGVFLVTAKVSPAVRPGQIICYHGWENYQFPGGIGHRNVIPTPINPVELAGGYLHIDPMPAFFQPGHNDRDTRVEVERG